jgi:hypothetical protein
VPGDAVRILALRDELASRGFDQPGEWWPEQPGVIGGRDRTAGGSWCVSDIATGTTAVVLNRPERRDALPGAASRGVLPLLAVRAGESWIDAIDLTPMASFNLALAAPDRLQWWSFDGSTLRHEILGTGTWMLTPRGRRTEPLDPRLTADDVPATWLDLVRETIPSDDPSGGLVVQKQFGDDSYETVFGQVIEARPGALRVNFLNRVARDPRGCWASRSWTSE